MLSPKKSKTEKKARVAATYERKSQGDEDGIALSLTAQKRENRQYCDKNDFKLLVSITEVKAISASIPLVERPGGKRLVELIESGNITDVVARETSRFCRNLGDAHHFRKICLNFGVTIHTVLNGRMSLDNPQSRFSQNVVDAVDELECDIVSDRGRRGKHQQARDGSHLGGPACYGYDTQATFARLLRKAGRDGQAALREAQEKFPLAGHQYPHPSESKVVEIVFELYTVQRWGTRRIANHLNGLGYRRRGGLPWHPDKIRKVIHNPEVAGFIPYDVERFERGGIGPRAPRHLQTLFPGNHEPIVSVETWKLAQEICEQNKSKDYSRGDSSKANQRYPLSGIMRCQCGSTMKAVVSGSHSYLVCRKRRDYGADAVGGCSNPRVNMPKAEEAFWNALQDVLVSDEFAVRVHSASAVLLEKRNRSQVDEPSIEKQLAKTIGNLDVWMTRHDSTSVEVEREIAYKRIVELTKEKKRLQELLITQKPKPKELTSCTLEDVQRYLSGLSEAAAGSKDRGCGLVQLLVANHGLTVKIVDRDHVSISFAFKPLGCDSTETNSLSIPIDLIRELPKGKVDSWLLDHKGEHSCSICGEQIEVLRRHFWHGIPKYHRNCWASKLTAKRSNPDPDRYYNGMEAAKALGVSRTQFGRIRKAGTVVAVERRSNVLLFAKTTIDELAKNGVPKP